MEQDLSGTEDKPYRIRAIIDSDNNLADDYTGQGLDMKRVTVHVSWPETRRMVTITAALNALLSGDNAFFEEVRMKEYTLSTVISSFEPMDKSCCDNPSIDNIEIIAIGGAAIDWTSQALPVSTAFTVRVGLNDNCPSRLPQLTLLYWYYGETIADAVSLELKNAGSLNYYAADVPASAVINADMGSPYGNDSVCTEEYAGEEPFDMFLQVYVQDDFIGEDCTVTVRESYSNSATLNIYDSQPPTISDYSSQIVANACDGLVMATILDGANGVAGLDLNRVQAYYAKLDAAGNKGSLIEIYDRKGPDAEGRFTWTIPETAIEDWSGGGTYDNLPDIYYEIVAYDKCDSFTMIPVGDAEDTYIKVTEFDNSPPNIVFNYGGLGFSECVASNIEPIIIDFDVIDECGVYQTAFAAVPLDIMYFGGDMTPHVHYIPVSPPETWYNVKWYITPDSRDDLWFRTMAYDSSYNYVYNPPSEDNPGVSFLTIHQADALYFPSGMSDPYLSGDVVLEGPSNDTVVLTLENFRHGDMILDSIEIKEPTYKSICLSSGDTSSAFPYIDRITIEIQGSSTYYPSNGGVIWDWRDDSPTPGSRERAPIELQLNSSIHSNLWIPDYGSTVKLYLHFSNQITDLPYEAVPFGMDQCDFEIIVKTDQSQEYKCPQTYIFSTKDWGYNYPPVANAGADNFTTVGNMMYFDARGSGDCDDALTDLTYYWAFSTGNSHYGATYYHTFTEDDFLIAKGGADDSEPAYIDVYLEVVDPSGAYDTDTMVVILFPAPTGIDTEICDDGVDNDGDGYIDCEDTDCVDHTACVKIETICNNGLDDDGDGYTDCDDPDCVAAANCVAVNPEICDNGSDDDGDGLVDCDDPDCSVYYLCQTVETNCNDAIDNDGDGNIDCADSDCEKDAACIGVNQPPVITSFSCTLLGGVVMGFTVTVDDPDDTIFHYAFDWGDGKSSSKTDGPKTTTSYTFSDNQTQSFTVTVTVNDASGSDVATVMVNCVKKAGCSCN